MPGIGEVEGGRPRRRPAKTPTTTVALALDQDLLRGAAVHYERVTGQSATIKETMRYAVDSHLDRLVTDLRRLGFRGGELGKRRPRKVRQVDWDRLQEASDRTGLPASALLRACLQWTKDTPTSPNPP